MSSLVTQDLRFAWRTLRRNPLFTAVAVLSLALGIGANTAIFSLLDQVLLRPLPVKDPEALVMLDLPGPTQGSVWNNNAFSYPMYREFRDRNPVFEAVLAQFPTQMSMGFRGQTESVGGLLVSGNYFAVLGIKASLGRAFTLEDDRTPGAHPVAMLSHGFWKRRFGGDRSVIGQAIVLNGHQFTVIGVGPEGFHGTEITNSFDVMTPLMMKAQMTPNWNGLDNSRVLFLNVYARLKAGITPGQAEAGMQPLVRAILEQELGGIRTSSERFRKRFVEKKLVLLPGAHGRLQERESIEAAMWMVMAMVALVLLIACANVANLLLARAAGRQKEMAIRLASGAGRWRLIRQLLVESVLLALMGGVAGMVISVWSSSALLSLLPADGGAPPFGATPDSRVLVFSLLLSALTGLLFGLIPALKTTRPDLAPMLKDQSTQFTGQAGHGWLRRGLVVTQAALALLLLIAAGLFARSLANLRGVNPGFRADHLLSFRVDPSLGGYKKDAAISVLDRLRDELAALPGVRQATMAAEPLLDDSINMSTVIVEGYQSKEGEDMNPRCNYVGPGFFATLGIPLVRGRDFTSADTDGARKVAVINESMAKYFFGGGNPLGRKVGFGRDRVPDREIVGVVKDGKHGDLREGNFRFLYVPYAQNDAVGAMTFYVRSAQEPASLGAASRATLRRIDENLPIAGMRTMEAQLSASLTLERMVATLCAAFGTLATVLAAIGLYGVMACNVARRTREIGLRMALGAGRRSVITMVLREVAVMTAAGIAVALPAAFGLGQYVQSQLFGLQARDPLTMAAATAVLGVVALLAGYVPARRAARVDPMVALRYE